MALVTELETKTTEETQPAPEASEATPLKPVEEKSEPETKPEEEKVEPSVAEVSETPAPMIQSISPSDDGAETVTAAPAESMSLEKKEEKKETEGDESIIEKIDDGLKSIDTPGEYIVITLVALLVGIIIGLILSSI
ncbi:hypothetical protein KC678_01360 [Candidatus Dojkabacteria bacterium]|uniref:Uncharacterized protein n=1 Tax=Candidatus Dojkabacteria bacterium TaxID=2099670 RepID=A0A955I8J1_9BACT|nr:hypothetical protein [Candidatus Dojkabacteria bacterium]